jgi:hypothetical protein
MATTIKVLGQEIPSAAAELDLYEVPTATSAIVSSLFVCNLGVAEATIRISVSAGGAGTGNKDYLYFGLSVPVGDTFVSTTGLSLGAGDVIRCYSSTGDVSFNVFGSEFN